MVGYWPVFIVLSHQLETDCEEHLEQIKHYKSQENDGDVRSIQLIDALEKVCPTLLSHCAVRSPPQGNASMDLDS